MLRGGITVLLETQLKKRVLQFLKKEYPEAWIYKASDRFTAGIPDLLIYTQGKFYAIELKAGNNRLTRIQRYTLGKIQAAGGRTSVCRSVEEVKEFLRR